MTDDPARELRVLLVDDDALVRSALQVVLSADPTLRVVGEAADGRAAVRAVQELCPDVVLMDIQMPVLDGVAATALVRALPDPPAVLVLTTFHADHYVLGALRAGASGFLLKDTPPAEIARAVHVVAAGDALLSPEVTRTVIARFSQDEGAGRRDDARRRLEALTDREREVAVELGAGRSNADIAAALFMSEATVKAHVSRALTKTGTTNRVQVAILVHDAGLAPPA